MIRSTVRALARGLLCVGLAACAAPPPAAPVAPPWQVLTPAGAPVPLYSYPEALAAYAPGDRGAYVVRLAGDAATRQRAAAQLALGDDVAGDDAYVIRLDATTAAALAARPGVVAVAPLAPADRRGVLVDRASAAPEVRVELFADATADEVAAVAAWITWRGGQVRWQGRAALRAQVPLEARTEASRLSVVRWIE
ncbi:MAG: hypothetical protein R3B06_07570 [Kofleriaceae bacterium]